MPQLMRAFFIAGLFAAIVPGFGWSVAAEVEVIVGGIAVYRDSPDAPEQRAAARELILVGGHFDGPQYSVPPSEIGRDLTASSSTGYAKSAEGIFHFFGRATFPDNDKKMAVSVVYYMRDIDPAQDPSRNPRFFSTALYPVVLDNGRRASVKVWLELWPTDRKIRSTQELVSLLTGIIRVRTAPPLYEDRRTQRDRCIEELQMVSALLPADREARVRMRTDAMKVLPASLKGKLGELEVDLEGSLEISEELRAKLLQQESDLWRAVRNARE